MVEPGQVLDGKYRIVRLIGEGGMGAVFEGENVRISRRVAIKVLHGAALSNAETVQRFEREAQAAGRIGSDHILEILDLGTLPDGERYMVMEFLAGDTLSGRIKQAGRLEPKQIVELTRQALVGLGAAHAAGIVHRDLKPDNIFVLREKAGIRDYVKIIDFGISKFNALGGDMSMTRTGAVMGTPYYMSPEQAKGSGQVDQRSDLYAIGVIMYEAATGSVPFNANTFNELLFKIVLSDPAPLAELVPNIHPGFAAVVARAMARDPAQRFGSAAEMMQALDSLQLGSAQATGQYPAAPFVTQTVGGQGPGVPAATLANAPKTQGSFATSQTTVPKRGNGALIGLAAAGGVLLLGVGAFAAFGLKDKSAGAASAASQSPQATPLVSAAPSAPAAPPPVIDARPPTPEPTPVSAPSASAAPIIKPPQAEPAGAKRPPVVARPPAGGAAKQPAGSSRDFGY
jgi:serine/threonine protein kinase